MCEGDEWQVGGGLLRIPYEGRNQRKQKPPLRGRGAKAEPGEAEAPAANVACAVISQCALCPSLVQIFKYDLSQFSVTPCNS